MLMKLLIGFLFVLGWTLSYAYVTWVKSTPKAVFGVFILFGLVILFTKYRFEGTFLGG